MLKCQAKSSPISHSFSYSLNYILPAGGTWVSWQRSCLSIQICMVQIPVSNHANVSLGKVLNSCEAPEMLSAVWLQTRVRKCEKNSFWIEAFLKFFIKKENKRLAASLVKICGIYHRTWCTNPKYADFNFQIYKCMWWSHMLHVAMGEATGTDDNKLKIEKIPLKKRGKKGKKKKKRPKQSSENRNYVIIWCKTPK